MEELIYPELPEGYVWKKLGETKPLHDDEEDVDIWHKEGLVAWVYADETDNRGDVYAGNRDPINHVHGQHFPVSSYQEGINLIHAQLMLGLIGVGKCLEE